MASPIEISVETSNSVSVQTAGQQPLQLSRPDRAEIQLAGTAESECEPYGRLSFARAAAVAKIVRDSGLSLGFALEATAFAQGGHYRTCARCVLDHCVGIFGHDTKAAALAESVILVVIRYTHDDQFGNYQVIVNRAGSDLTVSITDGRGNSVVGSDGMPPLIEGRRGDVYYVRIALASETSNEGGCCTEEQRRTAKVDLELLRAPIAFSAENDRYIRDGTETDQYKNIGALRLRGGPHCTATVIGKRTVLTAAHCLRDYDISELDFVVGRNISQPEFGPYAVASVDWPQGIDPPGYHYNPATLEDDIGIVRLNTQSALPMKPAFISTVGRPTMDELREQQRSLLFVGYGFTFQGDVRTGIGVKREASWGFSVLHNRSFSYEVDGVNTCKGDSGGPAGLFVNGGFFVVGVTSSGNFGQSARSQCTQGTSTRVDAYLPWLQPRVN